MDLVVVKTGILVLDDRVMELALEDERIRWAMDFRDSLLAPFDLRLAAGFRAGCTAAY